MGTADPDRRREQLISWIRQHAADSECWARAETVVRASELRVRLEEVGVTVTPDVAAALMATSMVLAAGTDEFGGDYRDALGDVAAVGLELLDETSP